MTKDHEQKPIDVAPYDLDSDRPPDENLEELAENLKNGYGERLVVFLGAGASVGARADGVPLPTAVALRNEIWARFLRPGDDNFDFGSLGMMPLDQAAAFAETKVGRTLVAEYMAARFRTDKTLWQHAVLPFLGPRSIYTTNYDLLIDQAWRLHAMNSRVSPLVEIFAAEQNVVPDRIPLYKPHGSADRALDPVGSGGPVITTIDYFDMVVDKREMLSRWLAQANNACVVMVGYSMTDMDIAAQLYEIKRGNGGLHWYGVFPRADHTVRNYWAERLRIRPINRRFAAFMADLDERIDFIPAEWKYHSIASHQRRGVIQ